MIGSSEAFHFHFVLGYAERGERMLDGAYMMAHGDELVDDVVRETLASRGHIIGLAMRAGAEDCIRKPFDPDQLVLRVESIVEKRIRLP